MHMQTREAKLAPQPQIRMGRPQRTTRIFIFISLENEARTAAPMQDTPFHTHGGFDRKQLTNCSIDGRADQA